MKLREAVDLGLLCVLSVCHLRERVRGGWVVGWVGGWSNIAAASSASRSLRPPH